METQGLVDKRSYLVVLGCLLQDSTLVEDIDRPLSREDFRTGKEKFYELLFVSIYNLHMNGCSAIDEFMIDSYLSNYPEQYKIFQDNNGLEYLVSAREMSKLENYDYHYHRMRKHSLLRYYESKGLDTRFIYDSTITDAGKAEVEQKKFDDYTEQDIVEMVEATFVINPNMHYCTNTLSTDIQAADGMDSLINELMEIPDVGLPLNNNGLNTIARGARRGCVFMRSAPSGGGKSRMLAGDACKFSVPYFWDVINKEWVYTGFSEPTLYITTEMTLDEIQTLFIACVSKVNEDHILNGTYEKGELERVRQAIEYIKSSPLYIVHIPDFSITDILNLAKKYNREFGVEMLVFDYVHSSLRLMSEVNGRSGMGLKEHQLLLVFITELKTLAQKLDIFIFTASQLNREAAQAQYKDQTLLAGATALANKLDVGIISMAPNKAELKKIEALTKKMVNMPVPNMAHWVYKVRRGKLTKIIIWTRCNLGTMTEEALFVTTYDFDLIDIDFTKIETVDVEQKIKENSVLITQVDKEEVIADEESQEESIAKKFDW